MDPSAASYADPSESSQWSSWTPDDSAAGLNNGDGAPVPAPKQLGSTPKTAISSSSIDISSATFTPKQLKELKKYFKQMDLNGDGHISANELNIVFKAMKMQSTPDMVTTLIRTADKSGNDELEFEEFVRLMENLKYTRPNVWTELLNKLNKSIWQQVMEGTKETLGLVDEESHRRDVHIYRQKSYFARRDVQQPERPSAMTGQLKRTATKLGLRKPDPPPKEDIEMSNDPLNDAEVVKQVIAAQNREYRPWFMVSVSIIQTAVLVASIIYNGGFEQPSVNYMLGPSMMTLLHWGARFVPCMRPDTFAVTDFATGQLPTTGPTAYFIYDNTTVCAPPNNTPQTCYYAQLAEVCGMGGFPSGEPNQWWRFILPLFLHVGCIHLAINIFVQLWRGVPIEREIGAIRMGLIYMLSGVFGIVLGANMSPYQVSVGASGAMYSIIALLYLDLFMNWPLLEHPWRDWLLLTLIVLFFLAVGLLPFIDNFALIGGFYIGILAGIIFVPRISFGKWDGRRKKIAVFIAIPLLLVSYFLVFWFFYDGKDTNACPWCVLIDCIPQGTNWCS